MVDHKATYSSQAEAYEQLVSHEDYQGNILRTLNQIRPLRGLDVLDLGAGTGRLACLVALIGRSIIALDASTHMLQIARARLQRSGAINWLVASGDHRWLPLKAESADVALAGWTIGQHLAWNLDTWQAQVEQILRELRRVLRSGGTIIILETLGTGHATPHALEKLVPYYSFLEASGFSPTWIRTDFKFESLAQAASLTRFFFGDEFAQQVIANGWIILPECTGLWWINV
jgi:ubiquinone/menaquinone biosynthesis C-methylase UbiE